MAFKTDKLQSRIIARYGTFSAFADALGMDKTTLSKLLSEGRDWKGSNMMRAIELLDIPHTEINAYFFDPRVEDIKLGKGK